MAEQEDGEAPRPPPRVDAPARLPLPALPLVSPGDEAVTLAPLHSHLVRGVKGKPGDLAKTCSAPGCISNTQQRHHIWSKSYLRGQPKEWVELPWGAVVQNSTGLCVKHHNMVTGEWGGHQAAIMLEGKALVWAERRDDGSWEIQGALGPQPVIDEELGGKPHASLADGETCPTCGYRKPDHAQPGPKRPARSWTMMVPADAELGADVLDGWVDDFAVLLGMEEGSSRLKRYHVLAVLLAWASQHKPLLIEDIRESRSA